MRLSKLLIPLLIITIFAACSSLFKEDDNGPELSLQSTQAPGEITTFNEDTLVFRRFQQGEGPRKYLPFDFENDEDQIIINGYYLAPAGYFLEGIINRNQKVINILVRHHPEDGASPNLPTGYFYNAYISNLEGGDYTVQIVHRDDLMRAPVQEEHTVFSKEFVIE